MIQKPFRGVQLNRTHPLAKGLVGCWIFNEMTGETVFDLSGHGNNGTLENGVAWDNGGLKFDGVNDYISVPDDDSLTPPKLTAFAWIYPKAAGGGLLWKYNAGTSQRSWAMGNSASGLQITLSSTLTPWTGIQRRSNQILSNNIWHQVGFVFDGSAQTLELYINGVNVETTDLSGTVPTSLANNNIPLYIGSGYNANYFNGSIDSVCIYNRALSAEEIAWLYREPYAMFEPAFNPALLYSAAPPVGAIMNQFQKANIGADLYNGVFA